MLPKKAAMSSRKTGNTPPGGVSGEDWGRGRVESLEGKSGEEGGGGQIITEMGERLRRGVVREG